VRTRAPAPITGWRPNKREKRARVRKVIVSAYVTLDGVMEDPGATGEFEHRGWTMPFFNEEAANYAHDELFASGALLLGRRTYDEFAASWPTTAWVEGEGDFAARMNGLPKFVASTTLTEPLEWSNSSLIKGDVAGEVAKLKQQPGQDILMYASAGLMRTLMQHHLIDEYRIWLHPIVLGRGKRLFEDGSDKTDLKLVDTTTFSSGVVVLSYQPAGNRAEATVPAAE
jgi:dihydrofolate reductase